MDQMRFVPHVPPNDPATLEKIRLPAAELQARLLKVMDLLVPDFVSIALFYNLSTPAGTKNVNNYQNTMAMNVTAWLHLGQPVTTSQFMRNYWSALSYGKFQFGVDANRDASGNILIPSISPANNDGQDWGDIASQIVQLNPEQIWQLSGSKVDSGKRIIPSVVLVMHYDSNASALFE
jgi:hypothetical protein